MRKPDFCLCENKGTDKLYSNHAVDQHLCFHFVDSKLILLSKSGISSLWPSSVALQPGLCWTWLETLKTCFLATRVNFHTLMIDIFEVHYLVSLATCILQQFVFTKSSAFQIS